ncbi:hypothetical protein [Erythrobacter donghaensis]|uniref:hypothetical protein n=1 Tax=Erythrobacter donghaensis TaxID=267135 RepID=UPI00117C8CEA|nr:hypothetical protein [Erythrobacter donghaensis]
MRMVRALAWLAPLVLASAPAQAGEPAPTAPRIVRPGGQTADLALYLNGYGRWDRDQPTPLRSAQALVDPLQWFGPESALARAHRADPTTPRYTTILLDITPEGTMAGCAYAPQARVIADEAQLCADIAGQRFLPQLADDGSRVPGTFGLRIESRVFDAAPDAPPRSLFTKEQKVTPTITIAPNAHQLVRFPPANFEVASLYRAPKWKTAPRPGWSDIPQTQPMSGLILHHRPDGLQCRVIALSGDPARDAAACAYARTELAPDWSGVEGTRDWMVPIAILHHSEGMIAIGPDPERIVDTRMAEGSEEALVTALTAAGVLPEGRARSPLVLDLDANADGSVRHCRVVKTTGKDATDIAACTIARQTVRLEPVENVFGTPEPLASLFWRAAPETD